MELSPKAITSVEFHLVRKGYDPDEVRAFLASLAKGVEAMQTQLANADARARAAVQRMQEVSAQSGTNAPAATTTTVAPAPVAVAPEPAVAAAASSATLEADQGQADTIARTLLLAQRTADATISDANERSRTIVAAAEERGRGVIDEAESRAAQIVRSAEERSAQMVDKAKADAVQAHAGERARIESEVAALTAQRSELHRHIDILGGHVVDQRTRLSSAAEALRSILDSPSGHWCDDRVHCRERADQCERPRCRAHFRRDRQRGRGAEHLLCRCVVVRCADDRAGGRARRPIDDSARGPDGAGTKRRRAARDGQGGRRDVGVQRCPLGARDRPGLILP
jgi:DivIVA domain-containing protein